MSATKVGLIQKEPGGTWAVFYTPGTPTTHNPNCDEVYDDQLTFDEALGCVAAILLGMEPRYLRSAAQWQKYNESREARMLQIQEEIREKT